MCPQSNNKETSLKYTSLPVNLSLNINNDQIDSSFYTSDLHINEQQLIDNYIDTLQNGDRNLIIDNSKTDIDNQKNSIGIQMPSIDIFSAIYASAVLGGGLLGYAKARSKPSLLAGLGFGCLLGIGTYMTSKDPNDCYLTLCTSGVLFGVMGKRFISSGKVMPAGIVSFLSLAMILRCAYQITYLKGDVKGAD